MQIIHNETYKAHQFDGMVPHRNNLEGSSLYRWLKNDANRDLFEVRRVKEDLIDEEDGSTITFERSRVFVNLNIGRWQSSPVWTQLKKGDVVYWADPKRMRLLLLSELEFKYNYSEIREVSQ